MDPSFDQGDDLMEDVFSLPYSNKRFSPRSASFASRDYKTNTVGVTDFDESSVDIYGDLSMDSIHFDQNNTASNVTVVESVQDQVNADTDMDLFTDVLIDDLSEKSKLQQKIKALEEQNKMLISQNETLQKSKENLTKNISCLFLTARKEIQMREEEISQLRSSTEELKKAYATQQDSKSKCSQPARNPDAAALDNIKDQKKTRDESSQHHSRNRLKGFDSDPSLKRRQSSGHSNSSDNSRRDRDRKPSEGSKNRKRHSPSPVISSNSEKKAKVRNDSLNKPEFKSAGIDDNLEESQRGRNYTITAHPNQSREEKSKSGRDTYSSKEDHVSSKSKETHSSQKCSKREDKLLERSRESKVNTNEIQHIRHEESVQKEQRKVIDRGRKDSKEKIISKQGEPENSRNGECDRDYDRTSSSTSQKFYENSKSVLDRKVKSSCIESEAKEKEKLANREDGHKKEEEISLTQKDSDLRTYKNGKESVGKDVKGLSKESLAEKIGDNLKVNDVDKMKDKMEALDVLQVGGTGKNKSNIHLTKSLNGKSKGSPSRKTSENYHKNEKNKAETNLKDQDKAKKGSLQNCDSLYKKNDIVSSDPPKRIESKIDSTRIEEGKRLRISKEVELDMNVNSIGRVLENDCASVEDVCIAKDMTYLGRRKSPHEEADNANNHSSSNTFVKITDLEISSVISEDTACDVTYSVESCSSETGLKASECFATYKSSHLPSKQSQSRTIPLTFRNSSVISAEDISQDVCLETPNCNQPSVHSTEDVESKLLKGKAKDQPSSPSNHTWPFKVTHPNCIYQNEETSEPPSTPSSIAVPVHPNDCGEMSVHLKEDTKISRAFPVTNFQPQLACSNLELPARAEKSNESVISLSTSKNLYTAEDSTSIGVQLDDNSSLGCTTKDSNLESEPGSSSNSNNVYVHHEGSNHPNNVSFHGLDVANLTPPKIFKTRFETDSSHDGSSSLPTCPDRSTNIMCTPNLIVLGDEETSSGMLVSPCKSNSVPSELYPPGVRMNPQEVSTHRHIRGEPEVLHSRTVSRNLLGKIRSPRKTLKNDGFKLSYRTSQCQGGKSELIPDETLEITNTKKDYVDKERCEGEQIEKAIRPHEPFIGETVEDTVEIEEAMSAVVETFFKAVFKTNLNTFKDQMAEKAARDHQLLKATLTQSAIDIKCQSIQDTGTRKVPTKNGEGCVRSLEGKHLRKRRKGTNKRLGNHVRLYSPADPKRHLLSMSCCKAEDAHKSSSYSQLSPEDHCNLLSDHLSPEDNCKITERKEQDSFGFIPFPGETGEKSASLKELRSREYSSHASIKQGTKLSQMQGNTNVDSVIHEEQSSGLAFNSSQTEFKFNSHAQKSSPLAHSSSETSDICTVTSSDYCHTRTNGSNQNAVRTPPYGAEEPDSTSEPIPLVNPSDHFEREAVDTFSHSTHLSAQFIHNCVPDFAQVRMGDLPGSPLRQEKKLLRMEKAPISNLSQQWHSCKTKRHATGPGGSRRLCDNVSLRREMKHSSAHTDWKGHKKAAIYSSARIIKEGSQRPTEDEEHQRPTEDEEHQKLREVDEHQRLREGDEHQRLREGDEHQRLREGGEHQRLREGGEHQRLRDDGEHQRLRQDEEHNAASNNLSEHRNHFNQRESHSVVNNSYKYPVDSNKVSAHLETKEVYRPSNLVLDELSLDTTSLSEFDHDIFRSEQNCFRRAPTRSMSLSSQFSVGHDSPASTSSSRFFTPSHYDSSPARTPPNEPTGCDAFSDAPDDGNDNGTCSEEHETVGEDVPSNIVTKNKRECTLSRHRTFQELQRLKIVTKSFPLRKLSTTEQDHCTPQFDQTFYVRKFMELERNSGKATMHRRDSYNVISSWKPSQSNDTHQMHQGQSGPSLDSHCGVTSEMSKESVSKPSVSKESVGKPSVSKESVSKELVRKASVSKESVGKPSVSKESVSKELVRRASVSKESVSKESVSKQSVSKESVSKLSVSKESVSKQSVRKESVSKVSVSKPSESRESVRKASASKESASKESVRKASMNIKAHCDLNDGTVANDAVVLDKRKGRECSNIPPNDGIKIPRNAVRIAELSPLQLIEAGSPQKAPSSSFLLKRLEDSPNRLASKVKTSLWPKIKSCSLNGNDRNFYMEKGKETSQMKDRSHSHSPMRQNSEIYPFNEQDCFKSDSKSKSKDGSSSIIRTSAQERELKMSCARDHCDVSKLNTEKIDVHLDEDIEEGEILDDNEDNNPSQISLEDGTMKLSQKIPKLKATASRRVHSSQARHLRERDDRVPSSSANSKRPLRNNRGYGTKRSRSRSPCDNKESRLGKRARRDERSRGCRSPDPIRRMSDTCDRRRSTDGNENNGLGWERRRVYDWKRRERPSPENRNSSRACCMSGDKFSKQYNSRRSHRSPIDSWNSHSPF